ncbi:MAG: hypothetical protein WC635_11235 [Bacteriovorax sp.]
MVQERCMNCGVNIEKDYILFINGTEFTFDSFECAINFVAPRCANCNTIVMSRGLRSGEEVFCSDSCLNSEQHPPIIP